MSAFVVSCGKSKSTPPGSTSRISRACFMRTASSFVRFVDLHAVQAEPIDDLGRPNAITDQVTRIAGRLGQLAAQLGLSPASEKALRHDAALEASHSKWLMLANATDEEIEAAEAATSSAAPAATAPAPATNGTPRMPGFTAPA